MHSHHLPSSNPNPTTLTPSPPVASPPSPAAMLSAPRGLQHRRARSEHAFLVSDNDTDVLGCGYDDDLFRTFMDIEKVGCRIEACGSRLDGARGRDEGRGGNVAVGFGVRQKHWHSNSMDGSSMSSVTTSKGEGVGEVMEAKKAMLPEQLAELAAIDPKRAKRILANRQSAARSKERKARYIVELERKVQALQTEATSLSAQLSLYQRDTTGLTAENTDLKLRLQAMEQQAQMHDALNEALMQEVKRLKIATSDMSGSREAYDSGLQKVHYNPLFFGQSQQQPSHHHDIHLQSLFSQPQHNVSNHRLLPQPHALSDMMHGPVGRLQGLDIRSGSLLNPEGSSVSASESSSTV